MSILGIPHGGCNYKECKECFPHEVKRKTKMQMHELFITTGHKRVTTIDEKDLYQFLIESAETSDVIIWSEHADVRIEYIFH